MEGKKYRMTVAELKKACSCHKYLILSDCYGHFYGINGGISALIQRFKKYDNNQLTTFTGYRPANIDQYITTKLPLRLNEFFNPKWYEPYKTNPSMP